MLVNGVEVKVNGLTDITEKEIVNYINYIKEITSETLASLTIPMLVMEKSLLTIALNLLNLNVFAVLQVI